MKENRFIYLEVPEGQRAPEAAQPAPVPTAEELIAEAEAVASAGAALAAHKEEEPERAEQLAALEAQLKPNVELQNKRAARVAAINDGLAKLKANPDVPKPTITLIEQAIAEQRGDDMSLFDAGRIYDKMIAPLLEKYPEARVADGGAETGLDHLFDGRKLTPEESAAALEQAVAGLDTGKPAATPKEVDLSQYGILDGPESAPRKSEDVPAEVGDVENQEDTPALEAARQVLDTMAQTNLDLKNTYNQILTVRIPDGEKGRNDARRALYAFGALSRFKGGERSAAINAHEAVKNAKSFDSAKVRMGYIQGEIGKFDRAISAISTIYRKSAPNMPTGRDATNLARLEKEATTLLQSISNSMDRVRKDVEGRIDLANNAITAVATLTDLVNAAVPNVEEVAPAEAVAAEAASETPVEKLQVDVADQDREIEGYAKEAQANAAALQTRLNEIAAITLYQPGALRFAHGTIAKYPQAVLDSMSDNLVGAQLKVDELEAAFDQDPINFDVSKLSEARKQYDKLQYEHAVAAALEAKADEILRDNPAAHVAEFNEQSTFASLDKKPETTLAKTRQLVRWGAPFGALLGEETSRSLENLVEKTNNEGYEYATRAYALFDNISKLKNRVPNLGDKYLKLLGTAVNEDLKKSNETISDGELLQVQHTVEGLVTAIELADSLVDKGIDQLAAAGLTPTRDQLVASLDSEGTNVFEIANSFQILDNYINERNKIAEYAQDGYLTAEQSKALLANPSAQFDKMKADFAIEDQRIKEVMPLIVTLSIYGVEDAQLAPLRLGSKEQVIEALNQAKAKAQEMFATDEVTLKASLAKLTPTGINGTEQVAGNISTPKKEEQSVGIDDQVMAKGAMLSANAPRFAPIAGEEDQTPAPTVSPEFLASLNAQPAIAPQEEATPMPDGLTSEQQVAFITDQPIPPATPVAAPSDMMFTEADTAPDQPAEENVMNFTQEEVNDFTDG